MTFPYPNFGTSVVTTTAGIMGGAAIAFPATIAGNGSWISPLLLNAQNPGISFAANSSQNGSITIQRFADLAGTIPVGAAYTNNLTGGTAGWAGGNDGVPYLTYQITIANSAGSTANITNCMLLTGPR